MNAMVFVWALSSAVGAGLVVGLILRARMAELRARDLLLEEQLRATQQTVAQAEAARKVLQDQLQGALVRCAEAEERARPLDEARARIQEMASKVEERDRDLQALRETLANLERSALEERGRLQARIAELETEATARERAFEEARQRLQETFQAQAAQALQANSQAFLELARTSLQQIQGEAKVDLEARQAAIATLLEPLKVGLQAMDQQIQQLQQARAAGEAQIKEQVQTLVQSQRRLQDEASRLANALRKPQVRGRWGELHLQNLVELAGMTEYVDFVPQASVENGDQRRRPDLLVRLPGGKCIAVDAKTPMGVYLDALEQATEEERKAHLDRIPDLIRTHVNQLAEKRYYEGLPASPDFVVLFLHGEGPFALACERDPNLLQEALQKNVLLATPVTLMALLKSAAFGWQQQRIQENAAQIGATAAELVKRMATMTGHMAEVGKGLGKASQSYNAFVGSWERQVLPQARRVQELGVQAYKNKGEVIELKALDPVDIELRTVDPSPIPTLTNDVRP